jgi:peptidoglycan/xylan/chitin deacetylase (PgdA/CDA1 family)
MITKKNIVKGIATLLALSGVTSPSRCGKGLLSIVTFHRVLPEDQRRAYPFPGLVVTPDELDAFLAYFTEYFDCGTLANQHKRFLNGESTKRPLLAITFDDAQHDNHAHARPVLARHEVNASFFVPVEAVEKQELLWHDLLGFAVLTLLKGSNGEREKLSQLLSPFGLSLGSSRNSVEHIVEASKNLDTRSRLRLVERLAEASGTSTAPEFARLMTFGELADLAADGHEIGSHSMTHCMMTECDDEKLKYELNESRQLLQTRIRQPIESFCYPNGNSDAHSALAVANAGYLRAVTTTWGRNGHETDRFQLRRCDMDAQRVMDASGRFIPPLLAFRMSGLYPGLGS